MRPPSRTASLAHLFALTFVLGGSAACNVILGYDRGTLEAEAGADGGPPADAGDAPSQFDSRTPNETGSDAPRDGTTPEAGGDSGGVDSSPPPDARDTGSGSDAADAGGGDASITCPGCPPGTTTLYLSNTVGLLTGIAVDNTNVYFAADSAGGGGIILSCSKTSCMAPAVVAKDTTQHVDTPVGVTVDATKVYWANASVA